MLLDAGSLALDYFKKTKQTIKKDGSIVTEADIAVEKFLRDKLSSKNSVWIGEESSERLSEIELEETFKGVGFIVDPIDGTMNYANGLEMWGISVGFLKNGELIDGVVYFPCINEIFITRGDKVHFLSLDHKEIKSDIILDSCHDDDEAFGKKILSVTQAMAKNEIVKYPGPIHSISSAVYTICKLITGSYYGYIGKLKIWDLAAVYPMCQRLGYEVVFTNGKHLNSKIDKNQYILELNSKTRYSAIDRLIFCPQNHSKKLIDQLF